MYPELGETCLLISTKVLGGLMNRFVARASAALMADIPTQAGISFSEAFAPFFTGLQR